MKMRFFAGESSLREFLVGLECLSSERIDAALQSLRQEGSDEIRSVLSDNRLRELGLL